MPTRAHTTIESPIGPITLVSEDGDLCGLYMVNHRHQPPTSTFGDPTPAPFAKPAEELTEYFLGERTEFTVPVRLHGTDFQQTVWTALQDIHYGESITYGELAHRIGRPTASRAVGLANGKNPISIIIPCHRVVGASGSLTGYGGGLDRKRHLLDLEASHLPGWTHARCSPEPSFEQD